MFSFPHIEIRAYRREWGRKIPKTACDLGRAGGFQLLFFKIKRRALEVSHDDSGGGLHMSDILVYEGPVNVSD